MNLFVKTAAVGLTWVVIAAFGQSLSVPVSTGDPKKPGSFPIVLDSPAGKAPVSLQWEVVVPAALTVGVSDLIAGEATETARKALICAVKPSKEASSAAMTYVCIVAGGARAIGNGVIATVQFRIRVNTEGAPIRVGIEKILAVYSDLRQVPLPDVDAVIKVR